MDIKLKLHVYGYIIMYRSDSHVVKAIASLGRVEIGVH